MDAECPTNRVRPWSAPHPQGHLLVQRPREVEHRLGRVVAKLELELPKRLGSPIRSNLALIDRDLDSRARVLESEQNAPHVGHEQRLDAPERVRADCFEQRPTSCVKVRSIAA